MSAVNLANLSLNGLIERRARLQAELSLVDKALTGHRPPNPLGSAVLDLRLAVEELVQAGESSIQYQLGGKGAFFTERQILAFADYNDFVAHMQAKGLKVEVTHPPVEGTHNEYQTIIVISPIPDPAED